jgi:hypothetical protein
MIVDELIGTGVVKLARCHPDANLFVKVVVASNVPCSTEIPHVGACSWQVTCRTEFL